MSIKRINQFPEGSGSLSNDDVFLFMDDPSNGGITKKISLSQIANAIGGGGVSGTADTGDITFDSIKIIGSGTGSGDGSNKGTIELVPDNTLYNNDQYLIIDPTAPNHIHLRAGGTQDGSDAELIVGGEQAHVKVTDYDHKVQIKAGGLGVQTGSTYINYSRPDGHIEAFSPLPPVGATFFVNGTFVTVTDIDPNPSPGPDPILYISPTDVFPQGPVQQTINWTFGSPSYEWNFNNQGNLEIPAGIVFSDGSTQTTAAGSSLPNINVLGNTSGTINVDASEIDITDITLTGNATLANPTNPVNGKTLRWRISQDSTGNRAVTLGNKFNLPSSASSPLPWSTSANKMDVLAATYHSGRDKWDIVAFVPGY